MKMIMASAMDYFIYQNTDVFTFKYIKKVLIFPYNLPYLILNYSKIDKFTSKLKFNIYMFIFSKKN